MVPVFYAASHFLTMLWTLLLYFILNSSLDFLNKHDFLSRFDEKSKDFFNKWCNFDFNFTFNTWSWTYI